MTLAMMSMMTMSMIMTMMTTRAMTHCYMQNVLQLAPPMLQKCLARLASGAPHVRSRPHSIITAGMPQLLRGSILSKVCTSALALALPASGSAKDQTTSHAGVPMHRRTAAG